MKFPTLLQDYFSLSVERFPDKYAIVAGNSAVTYKELDEKSDLVAVELIKSGLQPGERVIIFLDNSVETVIAFFAVLKAGGIFILLNSSVKKDKLNYIIRDSNTKIVITDIHKTETVINIFNQFKENYKIVVVNPSSEPLQPDDNIKNWNEILASNDDCKPLLLKLKHKIIDDDLAAIIYTSGSTGEPKGIMCPHFSMIAVAKSISDYLENSSDDKILNVLPLSFGYGFYQVVVSLIVGSTLYLEKSFMFPIKIIQEIQSKKITGFALVPTIAAMLLNIESISEYDYSSLKYLTNAGGPLSVEHLKRLKNVFSNAKIFSMYGLTECQRVSYLPDEEIYKKPGSVGKPIPNTVVKIVDNDGNEVKNGSIGELIVRGSNVMRGYWNAPELTKTVFKNEGVFGERYLFTGDLFHRDKEGFLYFHGRKDDLIKTKGERVSPKEIENVIYKIGDVIEAAVIGIPDEILGNALEAFIVKITGSPLNEKDVQKFCSERLENFLVPKYVVFISELPKTENGKIDRKAIKELKQRELTSN